MKRPIALLFLLINIAAPVTALAGGPCANCILKNRSQDQDCALEDGPLTRCEQLPEFTREDKRLNKNYKSLQDILSAGDALQLRTTKRALIKWRDETCEQAEEGVGCDNGVCAGVEHDGCIVKLTRVRGTELENFAHYPASGIRSKFAYVQKYTGWLRY